MNMHSHMRIENSSKHVATEKPAKAGLWKLLVAAALILAGLIGAIEIFGDKNSDFATRAPQPITLVE